MLWTRRLAYLWHLSLLLVLAACESNVGGTDNPIPGDTWEPPRWHYSNVAHNQGPHVFSDIWGADDGGLYVVGQFGFIMTNRDADNIPSDTWTQMPSPTQMHLTAITGLNDGTDFNLLDPAIGELFAVGWQGTLLHYNPNPDDNRLTHDGRWTLVAGPEGAAFSARLPVDPACPDYDGDGIPDDGDGSGFSGDAPCTGGATTNCDDNCRRTANGIYRPIADLSGPCPDPTNPLCGCIDSTDDGVSPTNTPQEDGDSDGVGLACDPEDDLADTAGRFEEPLFGITATRDTQGVRVTAVGGNGALVTYLGPATATALTITDPAAWVARKDMTYRNVNDCVAIDAATGLPTDPRSCANVPASCPAQCNPRRNGNAYGGTDDCNCPSGSAQCCDASTALNMTGVGWTYVDSSGAAQSAPATTNACDPTTGECLTLCPGCFRRRTRTLRAVAANSNSLLAVGARGGILFGDPVDPNATWERPFCTPKPLDDRPLMTAIGEINGNYIVVGAAGLIMFVEGSAYPPINTACQEAPIGNWAAGGQLIETRRGAPEVFLSDVFPTGGTRGYTVGDRGTLLRINGGGADIMELGDLEVTENFYGIWRNFKTIDPVIPTDPPISHEVLWIVGASGVFVHAEYY